jgi:hypothetical protein
VRSIYTRVDWRVWAWGSILLGIVVLIVALLVALS